MQAQLDELKALPESGILAALAAAVTREDAAPGSLAQLAAQLGEDGLDSRLLAEIEELCGALVSAQEQRQTSRTG